MKLEGVLDATAVCQLWAQRETIFKETELDLAGVEQITSAGIALLVKWGKAAEQSGKTLTLLHVPVATKHALMLFGVETLFRLKD